ncbi:MAG: EF-hand domain-containing protein [Mariniblastus sp.]
MHVQFSIKLLLLCFVTALLPLSKTQAQQKSQSKRSPAEIEVEDDDRDLLRFKVYAKSLMEQYDADDDGFLSASEIKKMRRPPSQDQFDENSDSKISFNELVESLRRPWSEKAVSDTEKKPNGDEAVSRYKQYADSLIRSYDKDGDGLLAKSEVKRMRRKPADDTDQDGDGKLSSAELARSMDSSRNKSPAAENSKSDVMMDDIYRRLSEQVLKTSDSNGNGQLDPEEIKAAQWTGPWKPFDANSDGIMSKAELSARYKSMLSKSNQPAKPESKKLAKQEVTGLMEAISRESKVDEYDPLVSSDQSSLDGLKDGEQLMGGAMSKDGKLIIGGYSIGRPKKKAASKLKANPDTRAAVQIYLFQLPEGRSFASLDDMSKRIKNSNDLSASIAKIAKTCGGVDQVMFTTNFNSQTEITSGAEVPVVTGETEMRGRTVKNYSNHDVGLSTSVSCQKQGDKIAMDVKIQKSAVGVKTDSADNEVGPKIVSWTFGSRLIISDGKPEVIVSTSGDENWLLIAIAKEVN